MWEHAEALVGVPEAIKATIEIIEHFISGRRPPRSADGSANLRQMRSALHALATDAVELAAYKALHKVTNSLLIDLRETFTITVPGKDRARNHYHQMLTVIETEFVSVWEGHRGGGLLEKLRNDAKLMTYLRVLPGEVTARVRTPPWDAYYWSLLSESQQQCGNFDNLCKLITDLRTLTVALNNFADNNLAKGIEEFNSLMDRLRSALARH
jgi:hypothetical protein